MLNGESRFSSCTGRRLRPFSDRFNGTTLRSLSHTDTASVLYSTDRAMQCAASAISTDAQNGLIALISAVSVREKQSLQARNSVHQSKEFCS